MKSLFNDFDYVLIANNNTRYVSGLNYARNFVNLKPDPDPKIPARRCQNLWQAW